jgi:hypothetical protein
MFRYGRCPRFRNVRVGKKVDCPLRHAKAGIEVGAYVVQVVPPESPSRKPETE